MSGACVAEEDVAYVVAIGPGTASDGCTQDRPCGTLKSGLATQRPYIKVKSGTINDSGTIIDSSMSNDGHTITILADPGAKITAVAGAVLMIQGAVNVEIHDLEIAGDMSSSPAPTNEEGILVQADTSGNPTVRLVHVKIDNNLTTGVMATGGNISISRSSIFSNGSGGITISGQSTTFSIINSLIYLNGDSMNSTNPSTGGLLLTPGLASKLEFNTIVGNFASTIAGGETCDSGTAANITSSYNIFWQNRFPSNSILNTNPQISSLCKFTKSLISIDTSDIPGFQNPSTNDYHLTAASLSSGSNAVIDQVTNSADCTGVDLDGNSRVGNRCDYGAYERTP